MGLFDIFNLGRSSNFETLLADLVKEADAKSPNAYGDSPYHQLEVIKKMLQMPPEELASFITFLLDTAKRDWLRKKSSSWSSPWRRALKTAEQLLKRSALRTSLLEKVGVAFIELRNTDPALHEVPYMSLLTAMQKAIAEYGHTLATNGILESLLNNTPYPSNEELKQNDLILFLLQDNPSLQVAEHDLWGVTVIAYLRESSLETRNAWVALFAHCKSGAGKSTPTSRWLKSAVPLLEGLGHKEFAVKLAEWLQLLRKMLQEVHKKTSPDFLRDENHEIIKGLIWCTGIVKNASLNSTVEDYAVWAYKKMPGFGSLSIKTGTAAMFAFSMLPVKEGVARLSKFKMKVKNNSILKSIDKIMRSVAEQNGISILMMEELAVPDFGIVNGEILLTLPDCVGCYAFATSEISWRQGEKHQKSIPIDVKEEFAGEIKSFKKVIKEATEMLPVIKTRLEASFLQQMEWEFATWRNLYIEHPLTSIVAKKMIWHFDNGMEREQGILIANEFVNAKGEPIAWLDDSTKVQLWHPIAFTSEQIFAWRQFLTRQQIVQPFKQAFREVYILTDAELRTDTYSNRFAAHILRQHQFAALLRQRGWHYTLMGNWDSHNTPYIVLPRWNMTAEYFVNSDWATDEENTNGSGIFNYITTDQVRFSSMGIAIQLMEVPALVFSEIMRDVDLFVGVTSIGNDAAWQDGGDRLQAAYWHGYSFSDLTESAKIRSQVLESLIPMLKIAPVCSFDKKFLIVKGKLRTYKIHMGSGNILMEPDDRYLCIVPESKNVSKTMDKVFLPFEGDNILSIIISKALLLAEDDKIKDETITRQIKVFG